MLYLLRISTGENKDESPRKKSIKVYQYHTHNRHLSLLNFFFFFFGNICVYTPAMRLLLSILLSKTMTYCLNLGLVLYYPLSLCRSALDNAQASCQDLGRVQQRAGKSIFVERCC